MTVEFKDQIRIMQGARSAVYDVYLHLGIRRHSMNLLGHKMQGGVAVKKHQRGVGFRGGPECCCCVILAFVVVSAGRAPIQGDLITHPLHLNGDSALGLDISEVPSVSAIPVVRRFDHGNGRARRILEIAEADGAIINIMALGVEGHLGIVNCSGAANVNGVFVTFAFVNEIGTARGDGHGCACHRKFALHVVLQCGAASAAEISGNMQGYRFGEAAFVIGHSESRGGGVPGVSVGHAELDAGSKCGLAVQTGEIQRKA